MSREVPLRALEQPLAQAQERLIDSVCGPRWAPVRGLPAPCACPRWEMAEDFVRKGKRTRRRKPAPRARWGPDTPARRWGSWMAPAPARVPAKTGWACLWPLV